MTAVYELTEEDIASATRLVESTTYPGIVMWRATWLHVDDDNPRKHMQAQQLAIGDYALKNYYDL